MAIRRLFFTLFLLLNCIASQAQAHSDSIRIDTLLLDDGTLYIGQIRDSLFNGQGQCIYTDGTIYEGSWKDGLWDGQGTLRYPDGDIYTGHFKEHEKDGEGIYMYSDGAKYEGQWKHDMFNGFGRLVFADGGVYEGAWKDDMKHGMGKLTSHDKEEYNGYFYYDEYLGWPFNTEISASVPFTEELQEWGFEQESSFNTEFITIGLSYSSRSMAVLSFWLTNPKLQFWGVSYGRMLAPPTRGKFNEWTAFEGDVHMEGTYPSSILTADAGFTWNRLSFGASAGVAFIKAYKNCRANGEQCQYDSMIIKQGDTYYKTAYWGSEFAFRTFIRLSIFEKEKPKAYTYLGYGNHEGLFLGIGISL